MKSGDLQIYLAAMSTVQGLVYYSISSQRYGNERRRLNKIVCTYRACSEGKMCPHVVWVALATDCVGALWGDESVNGATMFTNVRGLLMWGHWNIDCRSDWCKKTGVPAWGSAQGRKRCRKMKSGEECRDMVVSNQYGIKYHGTYKGDFARWRGALPHAGSAESYRSMMVTLWRPRKSKVSRSTFWKEIWHSENEAMRCELALQWHLERLEERNVYIGKHAAISMQEHEKATVGGWAFGEVQRKNRR